ncbi:MAG TPA: hypothetical protein GX717_07350 [Clostridiaceae bacterium]|nr:hypothetical protein [Clostridiaceae bacterium]
MDITAEDAGLALQGSATINDSGEVRDFNASVHEGNNHIGHINYSEDNGKISKFIHCSTEKETSIQALLNDAVTLIKNQP